MRTFLLLAFSVISTVLFAQDDTLPPPTSPAPEDTSVYVIVDSMPQFPGGEGAWSYYLASHTKYPKKEKKANKQGTVYIYFIIEKDGSVSNVKTKKGVPGAPGLSAEAERVIRNSPDWSPGTQNGKPVRVAMTVPIRFVLSDD